MSTVPSIELPGNICKVIAHQARGLVIKGKEDSNNAFVTFNLGKTKFATSVLEKVQDPVWNEECEFFISDYGGTLDLVVCHSDFLRERFLGRVEISISAVAASSSQCIKKWYKLQPKKGKEAKKLSDRGQLEVTVQLMYRNEIDFSQVKVQEKDKKSLLNILPSPVSWRRKSSGASWDGRKQEEYHNDINTEMQYHEQQPTEAAFYSDDSQSIASSMSDDHRDSRPTHYQKHHHHTHHRNPFDVVDQDGERNVTVETTPQKPPPSSSRNRFRPGGLQGSARGKGGVGRNVKAALGNITKALSRENMDKIGVSTPDLRHLSSSLPPTPIHNQHQSDRHLSSTDEPDSAGRGALPVVHLGVSSLSPSSTLKASAGPLHKSASVECLLERGKKEQGSKIGDQGDTFSSTTLPRGRHVKRENRHKKTKSACITTLSGLGFHEEHPQANNNLATDDHKGRRTHEGALDGKESKQSKAASKYDTLSKQQLVHLVTQQESILSDNIKQIKELEEYIERLLVRVMVESPQLLDQNYPVRS